jgi:Glycosyl transferase family 2
MGQTRRNRRITPRVTVLMAVYNGELHLREAIESIIRQTFQDFEFLIINDGSTDRTRELILSYDDPRIRLVDNKHQLGLTRSLNRGLRLAEGEWIARQDADDVSEPERLARQVGFLEKHNEVALLGAWYRKIDSDGAVIGNRELPCSWTQIRWSLLFICPFVHSAVMLRKSLLVEQIGFYDEAFAYAQDYDLWSRIARRFSVANLAEYLVDYRTTAESMTLTYGDTVEDEIFRIRTANLAPLVGSDEAQTIAGRRPEFSQMTSLLFGNYGALQPEEAINAATTVGTLQAAFCQYYRIGGKDCSSHRREIYSRIARRMVEIAHLCLDQDKDAAQQLLLEAYRFYWPLMFAKRFVGLYLKLLAGRHLWSAMRRPAAKREN